MFDRRRNERGATTAEYLGISVMVGLLVLAIIAFSTPVGDAATSTARKVYCKIGVTIGVTTGCGAEDLPGYIPSECTVNTHEGTAGGSITIIVSVGGDSGYQIAEVRVRQPDGSIKTEYVVRTKGKLGAGYEFSLGGGAEVDTGKGGVDAKASGSIKVGGDASWGSQYTFDNEHEAREFIERYKDNFGEFGSTPDGAPDPDSTYFDLSGQVDLKGEAGPLEGNLGQSATIGLETYANGDKKVKMALTMDAALSLGIPIPEQLLKLNAKGDISAAVIADVTFDKNGNVIKLGGSAQFTVEGEANIGIDDSGLKGAPVGENGELGGLTLPNIPVLEAGKQYQLNFSTDFRRPDGSIDHSATDALSEGLSNFITSGEGLTQEQQDAIRDQLDNHSQVTFNDYDYDRDETKYGASGKFLFIKLGGEVHLVTIDRDLQSSYYYDPVAGSWTQNIVCDG